MATKQKRRKRVALYLRVSTGEQTTENQRRELEQVAEHSGWNVVEVYEDAGISGANGREKRPAFDKLMKDANRRQFDMVGDLRSGDSPVQGSDLLAAGVRHGAVALNKADDLPVIVANLQAARARIVDIPDPLAVLIRDRPVCCGHARLAFGQPKCAW